MSIDGPAADIGFAARMSFTGGNLAEQWRVFKRQLTYYLEGKFAVTQLTSQRKLGIMMTALGREGVDILDTLFDSKAQPTYDEVVAKFDDYFKPKKNTVFERSVYFRLTQKAGQSVDMFLVELKKQAALCEFEKKELPKLLRDILVIGIRDAKLREELLRDPALDLEKATQACKARERSSDEASQIAAYVTPPAAVEQVLQRRRPPPQTPNASTSAPAAAGAITPCPNCTFLHGNLRPCPAATASCRKCGLQGHFLKVCRNRATERKVKAVEQSEPPTEEQQVDLLKIYCCSGVTRVDEHSTKAWYVAIPLAGATCKFKLDTAAECDTLSEQAYRTLSPRPPITASKSIIKPYNAPAFRPLGKINVTVCGHDLELQIMPGKEENLLGLASCIRLGLIQRVSQLLSNYSREEFVKSNADLFQGVGKIPGVHALHTKDEVTPIAVRPRRFAYSLLPKIIATLKDMVKQEIIVPVTEPTAWASNITAVEKADGTLRICLDPQNLNKALRVPKYVIPKADDILVQLAHKSVFTVIDLKSGFWHMELDEKSSVLTTFNSPLGRFRFKRLCFGINCAPEMFMAEMVRIFGDILGVYPYFDDLIIASSTGAEHDETLARVCQRAREFNIKFNVAKLQFRSSQVQFLGLIISPGGIAPAPKHIKAMSNMPQPTDQAAVMRFLGLVKFLARFIPNVSQLTSNLRALTRKETEFAWTPAHESEFTELKRIIASTPILAFFDIKKPVLIQTDASKDGLGSVLLQDGHPIAFASRALTPTEVRYSQIEKELLAIVFAVERFHEYVYGLPITVQSDHRPLEAILRKDLDKISPRLQRLRLRLLKYNVAVTYTPGRQMLVADTLSRAYLVDEEPNLEYLSVTVHTVKSLAVSPEKVTWIATATSADPVLADVRQWVQTDTWPESPSSNSPAHARFYNLRPSLTVTDDLLFYENRLVVPDMLRSFFLAKLHEGHLGAEKTKRLARETVFWHGLTADITRFVATCQVCQKFARNNVKQSLLPYPLASYPWQRLAVDIATSHGADYLVVVDKFSNWPEVLPMSMKSAAEVVRHLKSLFARYGIPEEVYSDNNPFNSATYMQFAAEWGFQATFTSPHYAQSNGHAERTVQTVKALLHKCRDDGTDFQYALLQYRNTPIVDTGFSPARVLVGRRLRTKLPVAPALLASDGVPSPVVLANKEKSQAVQQYYYDRAAVDLDPVQPAQKVWVKDKLEDPQWQPATVKASGPTPRSYIVEKDNDGGTVTRNRSFLRPRKLLARPARYQD